jgi:hypothetical protein
MARRTALTAVALTLAFGLAGCGSFDPMDAISGWDIMSSKKPLPGDRRAVFPEGVPGVPQGVPPELVKGYQAPEEPAPPPPVAEKPKPKKVAARPKKAAPPKAAPPPQQQTTTQPAPATATRTIPGAQPTWPQQAAPPPQQQGWPAPPPPQQQAWPAPPPPQQTQWPAPPKQ